MALNLEFMHTVLGAVIGTVIGATIHAKVEPVMGAVVGGVVGTVVVGSRVVTAVGAAAGAVVAAVVGPAVAGAGFSTRGCSVLVIGPVLGAVFVIAVSETVVCAGTGAAIGFLMSSIFEDRDSIILGSGVGTGVGSVIGVRGWPLFGVSAMGAVVVFVAGALLAHMRKNEIAEIWKNYVNVNGS